MSETQADSGMNPQEQAEEEAFLNDKGNVNQITVGTIIEYDDWQWALVTEFATDREQPMLGFILLDGVDDWIVRELEECIGCKQHYDTVAHLRETEHEYWAPVDYVAEDDIWTVLGPVHPDYRK